jgi:uncharacterized membrane protein
MFQDTPQQPQQPIQTVQPAQEQPVAGQAPQNPPQAPATPPPPPVPTTQEERIWAAIGYIGFLGVLTLAMMPKSAFCKKHAAHGLTIFVVWFVLLFAVLILLWPFPAFLVSLVEGLLFMGVAALCVLGVVKSIQSYDLVIPVLTPIALKFPVDIIIGTVTGKTPDKTEPPAAGTPPPPPQTPQQ